MKYLFHGTESEFDSFSTDFVGKGTDQYGPGFYLASDKNVASHYGHITRWKLLDETKIKSKEWLEAPADRAFIEKLIRMAPDLEDSLQNWDYNPVRAFRMAVDGICRDNNYEALTYTCYEFYKYHQKEFLKNVVDMGIDGICVRDAGKKFWIIYNPSILQKAGVVKENAGNEYLATNQIADIAKQYYTELNDKLWDNRLPDVNIGLTTGNAGGKAATTAGVKKNGVITPTAINISTRWLWKKDTLKGVVAHEMVHVWQYIEGKLDNYKGGHGFYFKRELERINQEIPDLNAPVEHSLPIDVSKSVKLSAIVYLKVNSDTYGVLTCRQSALDKIKETVIQRFTSTKEVTGRGYKLFVMPDAGPEYSMFRKSESKINTFVLPAETFEATKDRVEEEIDI